ncbi:MAG: PHB depolymerase family esterase [Pseudomonadota bacterium]
MATYIEVFLKVGLLSALIILIAFQVSARDTQEPDASDETELFAQAEPKKTLRQVLRGTVRGEGNRRQQNAAGGVTAVSVKHQGINRDYYYYVPASAGANPPLVIALHGGGGNALDFGRRTGMQAMADKYGYVVVLPQGTSRRSGGRKASGSWNANSTTGLDYAEQANIDDVDFMRLIMDSMSSAVNYDRNRVYVTGLSKGGMMAYHLACKLPERVAAIAVVAGTFSSKDCSGGNVALLHIHGTADENVPWEGGAGELSRRGANWPAVSRGIEVFSNANACPVSPRTERISSDTTCSVMSCGNGNAVEICLVEDGGHAWPGTSPANWQRKTNTYVSQTFDATDFIGAFFSRN